MFGLCNWQFGDDCDDVAENVVILPPDEDGISKVMTICDCHIQRLIEGSNV